MRLPELIEGRLVRRYKRFLADVTLPDGSEITAHCPTPGAMTGLCEPGSPVRLSISDNPKRKLAHSWELASVPQGWCLVNSLRVNKLVEEALRAGAITELRDEGQVRPEVKYGDSRLDFGLGQGCLMEVKCVTLSTGAGLGAFPDAKTKRGLRHVEELITAKQQGYRAVLFFLVARPDVDRVTTADHVDPAYGEGVRRAVEAGVEVLAYGTHIEGRDIVVGQRLPFDCSWQTSPRG